MELTIRRFDSKGVEIVTTGEYGLIIICQQTTKTEHDKIKELLETSLDLISSADIFYSWNNASVFIFGTTYFDEANRKSIADLLPKTKHTVLYNGEQVWNSSINDMYITHSKNELIIGKKFYKLLIMKKGVK